MVFSNVKFYSMVNSAAYTSAITRFQCRHLLPFHIRPNYSEKVTIKSVARAEKNIKKAAWDAWIGKGGRNSETVSSSLCGSGKVLPEAARSARSTRVPALQHRNGRARNCPGSLREARYPFRV